MQCKKCGQNITNPRAKFCPVCGSPLEQTSSSGNSAPSPRTSAARPAKRRENWERYESPYAWVKWVVLAVAVVVLAVGAAVAMVLLNQQAGKENPRREDPSGSSSVTAAASPAPAPEETPSPAPEEDEEEDERVYQFAAAVIDFSSMNAPYFYEAFGVLRYLIDYFQAD